MSDKKIEIKEMVFKEYRDYQIYTLMDRAIPYMRDGLKPSQRRILYTLYKHKNKGLIKVSGATGLVLTLHPHGPASIESSITNLAQRYTFSNNYPLIRGKGYFGERMETSPAASRYIECKLDPIAELLLFDDMNQVTMIPNYDEKVLEPQYLLPKLPLMLLNGAEGIGTGYSSMIPSFHHKDIIESIIQYITTGKVKKLSPWVNKYEGQIRYEKDKNRYVFSMKIEKMPSDKLLKSPEGIYITELPKGYDFSKISKYLNKLVDEEIIKDWKDYSKFNQVRINLIFKKGSKSSVEQAKNLINIESAITPNYTLISDNGVEVFSSPEEIITIFSEQRRVVTKRRYELLIENAQNEINKNNEIIRFIKERHYSIAEKKNNRGEYVQYLKSKKFTYAEYLSDMAIYRMTKEEVSKRQLLVKDDIIKLKEYKKILKSKKILDQKLIEELSFVKEELSKFLAAETRDDKKDLVSSVKKR